MKLFNVDEAKALSNIGFEKEQRKYLKRTLPIIHKTIKSFAKKGFVSITFNDTFTIKEKFKIKWLRDALKKEGFSLENYSRGSWEIVTISWNNNDI